MTSRRLRRAWQNLAPVERARLAVASLRDGTADDPLLRRTIPHGEVETFDELMELGLVLLTRLRPAAVWLEERVTVLETELELLRVRHRWAAERLQLLPRRRSTHSVEAAGSRYSWRTQERLLHGPSYMHLRKLRGMSWRTLVETAPGPDDISSRMVIERLTVGIGQCWRDLLQLEETVPVVVRHFENADLVSELLGARVDDCSRRLKLLHELAEELLGPIELLAPTAERRSLIEALLRSALKPVSDRTPDEHP